MTIHNDGKELRITLRDAEFVQQMLDDWEAYSSVDAVQLQQFVLYTRALCDFVLEFTMPLPVLFQTGLDGLSLLKKSSHLQIR